MRSLLPNYLGQNTIKGNAAAQRMQRALVHDDINQMFEHLQTFLGILPHADRMNTAENYEAHWQQLLYVIFSILGATCDVEVRTQKGRVDLVARTAQKLYLIEVKLNKDADTAMRQIDLKQYPQRFALAGLPEGGRQLRSGRAQHHRMEDRGIIASERPAHANPTLRCDATCGGGKEHAR